METTTVRRTALHDIHARLGAKLIPFAGFDMPVRYTGDKDEHMCVREKVGVFDVSHMGEFIIRGPKALEFIQAVTTNDASKLPVGKAQYSCFPNLNGGIVDDCIVYHIREEEWMIVVNASNVQKDWDWISGYNTMGAELLDISDKTSLIAVSGPKARATVQKLTAMDLSDMDFYALKYGQVAGFENILLATTGYTGEFTFEIFFRNEQAESVWNAVMEAGAEFGIQPCGLGARDTLRLEMGYMLYGNDIDDTTSPLEAPLAWITKLNKGTFVGSDWISRQKAEGVQRKLVGFVLVDKGIPRHGYEIAHQGTVVGHVTSGTISPMLNYGIGMGYVPTALAVPGTEIDILIRGVAQKARVVKTPFIERNTR